MESYDDVSWVKWHPMTWHLNGILRRRLLGQMASYDVASNVCPALVCGDLHAGAGRRRRGRRRRIGGVVQVKTRFESAWVPRLKLKYEATAFKLCFQFQLAPLCTGGVVQGETYFETAWVQRLKLKYQATGFKFCFQGCSARNSKMKHTGFTF